MGIVVWELHGLEERGTGDRVAIQLRWFPDEIAGRDVAVIGGRRGNEDLWYVFDFEGERMGGFHGGNEKRGFLEQRGRLDDGEWLARDVLGRAIAGLVYVDAEASPVRSPLCVVGVMEPGTVLESEGGVSSVRMTKLVDELSERGGEHGGCWQRLADAPYDPGQTFIFLCRNGTVEENKPALLRIVDEIFTIALAAIDGRVRQGLERVDRRLPRFGTDST